MRLHEMLDFGREYFSATSDHKVVRSPRKSDRPIAENGGKITCREPASIGKDRLNNTVVRQITDRPIVDSTREFTNIGAVSPGSATYSHLGRRNRRETAAPNNAQHDRSAELGGSVTIDGKSPKPFCSLETGGISEWRRTGSDDHKG
jgi:hypothetical protein